MMIRNYLYRCPDGHERNRRHPIDWPHATTCLCGKAMHRVPQSFRVNWGGLAPSQGGLGKAARELLNPNEQARLKDNYAEKKAKRGENWSPA